VEPTPSALPGISPSRGEIDRYRRFHQSPALQRARNHAASNGFGLDADTFGPPILQGEHDDISKQDHSNCRGVGYAGFAGAIPDELACARRTCAGFTAVARRANRRLHAANDA
ncbi:hypothetical protein, partial [Mesorhizobium sp.]|uniref:hypothetical protein n=1 Tax=Mesorhizobium sp. TaxID=1871066 RepID=UPI00257C7F5F